MARKNHPKGLRLRFSHETYRTRWFTKNPRTYKQQVLEDTLIRGFLAKKFRDCVRISIVRHPENVIKWGSTSVSNRQPLTQIIVTCAQKNPQISTKEMASEMKKALQIARPLKLSVERPGTVAEQIAKTLQNRLLKSHVQVKNVLKQLSNDVATSHPEVTGFRVECARMTAQSLMAARETASFRNIPRQRFSADIEYMAFPVKTSIGILGVKIWAAKA